MGTERTCGPQDGTEVARVRHTVQRDDQRGLAARSGRVEEVVGLVVLVRRDLDGDTLVDRVVGQAVQLGLRDLEEVVPAAGGDLEDLPRAVVRLEAGAEVDGGHGDACTERLEDGVASSDDLVRGRDAALGGLATAGAGRPGAAGGASVSARARTAAGPLTCGGRRALARARGPTVPAALVRLAALGSRLALRRDVVRALLRLGGWAAALEGLLAPSAGADLGPLLGACLAHRSAAL